MRLAPIFFLLKMTPVCWCSFGVIKILSVHVRIVSLVVVMSTIYSNYCFVLYFMLVVLYFMLVA
jgi:hypothetical protein